MNHHFKKTSKASISNFENLCSALDLKVEEVLEVLLMDQSDLYRKLKNENRVMKSDGSIRKVRNPHFKLRKIQQRIVNRLFRSRDKKITFIEWPEYIYGSIPNQFHNESEVSKDYIACARNHTRSKSILKIDVENFFNNINESEVYNIFINFFKFPNEVSNILTKLCCYEGTLVQGALTSSYLATLCLFDIEPKVYEKIRRKGLRYTRLLDDITVSSENLNYDYTYAENLIINMLHEKELPLNNSKRRHFKLSTEPLLVHGLRVNFSEPRLRKEEISNIRASVKHVEVMAKEPKLRVKFSYRKEYFRCLGRVNKLARLKHNQHKELLKRLLKLRPLPSKRDLIKTLRDINWLKKNYHQSQSSRFYTKRYYRSLDRISLIKESYPARAKKYRSEIKMIGFIPNEKT